MSLKAFEHFKKQVFLLLVIPLTLVSDHLYAAEAGKIVDESQPTRLMVLGDSISAGYGMLQSEGWVSLLQNMWEQENLPIDVINASVSGETTDGGLARLSRLIEHHQPTHLMIELGGNDGLQGHPVKKMQANLLAMIKIAQDNNIEVFLQDMEIPPNYGAFYTRLFEQSFDKVAEQSKVYLIPFFLQEIALQENLMQRDGIHPNKDAQPMIAEFIRSQLGPKLRGQ